MLQLVQYQKDGEIKVEEMPAAKCAEGGVLVQTAFSLISAGTEKASVNNAKGSLLARARKQPEQVKIVLDTLRKDGIWSTFQKVQNKLDSYKSLGYSASGVVIESDCTEFAVGDLVACAGAGYANHAELLSIPKNLCVHIPENVSMEEAAFTTLGSIAMQGFRQAEPMLGETVAVIGLGLLGQIAVQLLKSAGCKVIGMDVNEALFEQAKKFGCDLCLPSNRENVNTIKAFTRGIGCDAVIIAASTSSNEPTETALDICRKRGRVVVLGAVGMDIPRSLFYTKEIDFRIACSYGPGRYDANYEERGMDYPAPYVRWTENRNMQAVLDLIAVGKLDVKSMTSHKFEITQAPKAYDIITGKTPEKFLGILIEYPERKNKLVKSINLKPIEKKEKIGLGFVGAGQFAQSYLLPPLKKAGVDFIGVSTSTAVNALSAAQKFGFGISSTDSDELIANKDVSMVFCATRHDSHSKYVIKAMQANKPVFVEKPLAITMEELDKIKELADKGSRVMVGFNRRFSAPFLTIDKFFAARQDPMAITYRVNAGMIPLSHWVHENAHGGRIIGEVCHFIDCMAFLTKALPVSVYAESISTKNAEQNAYDTVNINIRFSDGSIGTVSYFANGDSSMPKEYCEVFCERASAIMDNFTKVEMRRNGKLNTQSFDGKKGINEEVAATVDAVKQGKPMPIAFDTLYAVTKATIMAVESLKIGMPLEV